MAKPGFKVINKTMGQFQVTRLNLQTNNNTSVLRIINMKRGHLLTEGYTLAGVYSDHPYKTSWYTYNNKGVIISSLFNMTDTNVLVNGGINLCLIRKIDHVSVTTEGMHLYSKDPLHVLEVLVRPKHQIKKGDVILTGVDNQGCVRALLSQSEGFVDKLRVSPGKMIHEEEIAIIKN